MRPCRLSTLAAAAALVVLFGPSTRAESVPTNAIVTASGTIKGERHTDGLAVFRGVPFAAPPVGDLRWREPQPVKSWDGALIADAFSPACMQAGQVGDSLPGAPPEEMSEDCLYLNIWSPDPYIASTDWRPESGPGNFPVIVWIYGGGFTNGSSAIPLYWGENLAKRGVVVVTINYRVGPFGFFAHPELTKESPRGTSGNQGLLDQIAALKWIKRNIQAFGGDPRRVTIWGQSAGSMSVSMLMASPLARGLFQRAIGESGGFFVPPEAAPPSTAGTWLLESAENEGALLGQELGARSMAKLRAAPAEQILKSANPEASHPIIDGAVLPDVPHSIFLAGRQNDVPILIGSNADEGRPFLTGASIKLATFAADIRRPFGNIADEVLALYPATTDAEARDARAAFERDLRFGWDMWTWARLQAKTGKGKVFSYYFAHQPPHPKESPFADWGAAHWAELPYVFDHLDQSPLGWTAKDREIAEAMATYWTNFAKTGDPNGAGMPVWPAFTEGGQKVLHIADDITAGELANREQLERFDAYFGSFRTDKPASP